MQNEFLHHIQHHVARSSVGASAARGQRSLGLVAAARSHLATIQLAQFGVKGRRSFVLSLDRETLALERKLPRTGQSWGISRKLLNIFLRNALYTGYLQAAFKLERGEAYYEVPLDKIVASELGRDLARGTLPRWPGVRHLTREVSDAYQLEARRRAAEMKVAPVHLDAYWWGGPREATA